MDAVRSGRPRISGENIEHVRQAFSRSSMKPICSAARELHLPKVRDITDWKQRISNAVGTIDEAMLQRTSQEIEYRLDVLRVVNGAHIEMY